MNLSRVGDERKRNSELLQLPRGKPGPLEAWSRFVDQHVNVLALFVGRPDDTQRGAIIHGRQRPRITVVEDRVTILNQRCTVLPQTFVRLDILISQ